MEDGWERRVPEAPVPPSAVEQALQEAGLGRPLRGVRTLPGGLINAHRLLELDDPPETLVLRIRLRADLGAAAREAAVLRHACRLVPAPEVIAEGRIDLDPPWGTRPWLLVTRVPGRPLASCMAQLDEPARARAGREIGEALARLHAEPRADLGFFDPSMRVAEPMGGLRRTWHGYLHSTLFGEAATRRLGLERRAALWRFVEEHVEDLAALEGRYALLHADCKPTNVLVDERGALTGMIDWEFAWSGPPLFDLGQMHRWPLPRAFEQSLAAGYARAGGALPPDWRRQARLLDLMNLAGFQAQPESRPTQTRDVLELLAACVASVSP